ncbi:MAG: glycosyltransferase family 39 protein, partial [Bacteroidota bacterium]
KDQFEDTNNDGIFNEYDFWSKGSSVRHAINVLLYVILVLLIYHVLSCFFFKDKKDMVFFAVLFFAVHPLHAEVVANIKSRDEILSLLMIFSTLFFTVKYVHTPKIKYLFYVGVFMLLALLSKEYALLLFLIIPALIYVYYHEIIDLKSPLLWAMLAAVGLSSFLLIKFFNSGKLIAVPVFFFFLGVFLINKDSLPTVKVVFALGSSLLIYLALRFSATTHDVEIASFKNDILANPYQFATPTQELASKIAVWLKYIFLLFVPNPLVCDYSFKSIPYSDFQSVKVWLSILIFLGLAFFTAFTTLNRNKLSMAFMLALGFFIPVMNIFIDIGATMGERLFFHASIGFCLLVSSLVVSILSYINNQRFKVIIFSTLVIFILFGFGTLTVKRNGEWKNNKTLFLADVEKVPANINILTGAGTSCYELSILPNNKNRRKEFSLMANNYYNKGIKIFPKHYPLYMNKAVNLISMGELDSSRICTDSVLKYAPTLPNIHRFRDKLSEGFMLKGVSQYEKGNRKDGMQNLLKSLSLNKKNVKSWNNLGMALFTEGSHEKALMCYKTTLGIDPKNKTALKAV